MFVKIVVFPPKLSILIGFSIIFTIHLGVPIIFGSTPIFQLGEIELAFHACILDLIPSSGKS